MRVFHHRLCLYVVHSRRSLYFSFVAAFLVTVCSSHRSTYFLFILARFCVYLLVAIFVCTFCLFLNVLSVPNIFFSSSVLCALVRPHLYVYVLFIFECTCCSQHFFFCFVLFVLAFLCTFFYFLSSSLCVYILCVVFILTFPVFVCAFRSFYPLCARFVHSPLCMCISLSHRFFNFLYVSFCTIFFSSLYFLSIFPVCTFCSSPCLVFVLFIPTFV